MTWTATWIRFGVDAWSCACGETKTSLKSLGPRGVVEGPGDWGIEEGNWSRKRLFRPGDLGGLVPRAGGRMVLRTEDWMSLPSWRREEDRMSLSSWARRSGARVSVRETGPRVLVETQGPGRPAEQSGLAVMTVEEVVAVVAFVVAMVLLAALMVKFVVKLSMGASDGCGGLVMGKSLRMGGSVVVLAGTNFPLGGGCVMDMQMLAG